mmetsp:Transcript_14576/g.20795  ORF Transcript_14576/g.20795 Transcript_14576/m.20795 type:complete len:225 (+) Transcript_14576:810-1484(+)
MEEDAIRRGFTSCHSGMAKRGKICIFLDVVVIGDRFIESSMSFVVVSCVIILSVTHFRPKSLLSMALGRNPPKTPKKARAAIHSAEVVASAAPIGPISNPRINKTSKHKFTTLAPTKTTNDVRVSKYPLNIPVQAEIKNTAIGAKALTLRNCWAYIRAPIPALFAPMTSNRGDWKMYSIAPKVPPSSMARESACPPTSIPPFLSPEARRSDIRGAVAVHKKLKA